MNEEGSFDQLSQKYKIPLVLSLVGVVLLVGGVITSGIIPKTFIKSTTAPKEISQTILKDFKIDVSGSVKQPGVYNLNSDSRVEDALKAAGGLSAEADLEYIQKNINLAQKLSDGMKLFIPKVGEPVSSQMVLGSTTISSNQSKVINVNSATLNDLDSLPGVGKVGAQKIIDNRPYSSIEELLTKKTVNKATYEKIKDQVSIY